jgi:uncharacterized protein YidB (DUF937 family)
MGLLDILSGMSNAQSGQPTPESSGGGMSPITKAIIGVLAYQAIKAFTANQASAGTGSDKQSPGATGGGLDGLLKGGLGGLLGGGGAGSAVSGGLNDLLKQFQQNGQGDVAKSWIGPGANKAISPNDLASALGADRINTLAGFSGMSRDDLLNGLSQQLPDVIDRLTPNGRLPTEQEAARFI